MEAAKDLEEEEEEHVAISSLTRARRRRGPYGRTHIPEGEKGKGEKGHGGRPACTEIHLTPKEKAGREIKTSVSMCVCRGGGEGG